MFLRHKSQSNNRSFYHSHFARPWHSRAEYGFVRVRPGQLAAGVGMAGLSGSRVASG
ncbi:hypothetical protein D8I24_5802 [Cupriavidus necator H850]|nr:hypothetical protein D8I24_5802 [Cupriavidus necator H850]